MQQTESPRTSPSHDERATWRPGLTAAAVLVALLAAAAVVTVGAGLVALAALSGESPLALSTARSVLLTTPVAALLVATGATGSFLARRAVRDPYGLTAFAVGAALLAGLLYLRTDGSPALAATWAGATFVAVLALRLRHRPQADAGPGARPAV